MALSQFLKLFLPRKAQAGQPAFVSEPPSHRLKRAEERPPPGSEIGDLQQEKQTAKNAVKFVLETLNSISNKIPFGSILGSVLQPLLAVTVGIESVGICIQQTSENAEGLLQLAACIRGLTQILESGKPNEDLVKDLRRELRSITKDLNATAPRRKLRQFFDSVDIASALAKHNSRLTQIICAATLSDSHRVLTILAEIQVKLENGDEGMIISGGRVGSGGSDFPGGSGGKGERGGGPQVEMDTNAKGHVSGSIGGGGSSRDGEGAVGGWGGFGEGPVIRSGVRNVNGESRSTSEDNLNSASDINQLASEGGDFKQWSHNAAELASKGGFGKGPRITTALVDRSTLEGVTLPEMSMTRFCTTYSLGEELRKIVLDTGYENAVDLLFAEDLSVEKFEFKIGQVAELSWALADMLLQSKTVSAIDLIKEGDNKPDLIGGIGGSGGKGKKGGTGGDGMGPRVPLTSAHRFRSIGGGIGGPGGFSLSDSASTEHGRDPPAEKQQQVSVDSADLPGTLQGGRGGVGGWHPELGGIGGGGGGPVLSIKAVGHFQRIHGGQGGPGGNSNNQGGQGGAGHAPEFSELLCTIDTETRLRVSNVKLRETAELKAARFDISDTLNSRLQQCGFETVCGLFHVQENDLPDSIFKMGHKMTLKRALTEFRRNVATQSKLRA
ncbi:hypothetical protein C8R45DRAFT_1216630 [Mycena sanguinolenta]|nr:hypothetical protein C8R45DRAFT_1216630 [Mycena sanguinolenta]